jgi:hypothetical protein
VKKFTWILIVVFAASLFIWGFAISQEKPKTPTAVDTAKKEVTTPAKTDTTKKVKEHAYVGATKCKMCHNQKKWGMIYDKWAATKHASAYTTLANKQSQAIAKELKIADAQKSEKCLVCHVTGYGVRDELKQKTYSMEEGVTCEACHGPAGDYLLTHMKAEKRKQTIEEDGLILPSEELSKELCVKCHNQKSPTYKEFKYKEAIKLVEHHRLTEEELKKLESKEEKPEGK